ASGTAAPAALAMPTAHSRTRRDRHQALLLPPRHSIGRWPPLAAVDRLALEGDEDAGLAADHPAVVAGREVRDVALPAPPLLAVVHPDVDPSRHHVAGVGPLAARRVPERPGALGPLPAGLQDVAVERHAAQRDDVDSALRKGARLV